MKQMEMAGEYPDGSSSDASVVVQLRRPQLPFIGDKLKGRTRDPLHRRPSAACPTSPAAFVRYDFGDAVGMGPVVKMFTLGHSFIPDPHPTRADFATTASALALHACRKGRRRGARVQAERVFAKP